MQIFNFQDNINRPVRTQIINDEPFWVLKDVCDILELKNITMVKSRLNQKGLSNNEVLTNGGTQQMIMINEGNLYKCVLQSRKKEAIEFENWITEKVLPTIRTTGKFEIQQPQIDSKFLLQIAQEMQKKELLIEEQKQTIDNQDNTIDQISNTQETYSITEASKKLNLKICQLTQYLVDKKWIRYLLDPYKTKKPYSTSYATQSNFGTDKTVFNKKLNSYFHQFRVTSHGMNYLIKRRNNIIDN